MPKVNLTQRWITSVLPKEVKDMTSKETWFMDINLPGFGIRVKVTGQASFGIRWQDQMGRSRKKALGDVKSRKIEDCRKIAFNYLSEYQAGRDPEAEKKKRRKDILFSKLIEDVFEHKTVTGEVTKNHIKDQERSLNKHAIPTIGKKPVRDIEPMDLDRILQNANLKPAGHNRLRSALSLVFKQAQKWRIRFDDPTLGLRKKTEAPREKVLTDIELGSVWKALNDTDSKSSANAIRLIILTGARPAEVFSATWDQFNLDEGIWKKPAMSVKQRRVHNVQLHPTASSILKSIYEMTDQPNKYVFPSNSAKGHLTSVKTLWGNIRKSLNMPEIRIYDIRRTFMTNLMANSELSLAEVMAITGHSQPTVLLKHYTQSTGKGQMEAIGKALTISLD